MSTPENPRIRQWFAERRIAEAILGDGSMFIPDIDDSTQHDRILVLGQLFAWAKDGARRTQALSGIQEAVDRSLARHEVRDALDIAWCLLILADLAEGDVPVDWDALEVGVRPAAEQDSRIDQAWVGTVLQRLAGRTSNHL